MSSRPVFDMVLALLLVMLWLLLLSGERWRLLGTVSPLALTWRMGTFGLVPLLALLAGSVSPYARRYGPLALAAAVAALPRTLAGLARLEAAELAPLEVIAAGSSALAWLFLFSIPLGAWALPQLVRPAPAAAAWYADPSGRHRCRWFDGTVWTGWVADGGMPSSCDWPDGSGCSHTQGDGEDDAEVVDAVREHGAWQP